MLSQITKSLFVFSVIVRFIILILKSVPIHRYAVCVCIRRVIGIGGKIMT